MGFEAVPAVEDEEMTCAWDIAPGLWRTWRMEKKEGEWMVGRKRERRDDRAQSDCDHRHTSFVLFVGRCALRSSTERSTTATTEGGVELIPIINKQAMKYIFLFGSHVHRP